jgi:MFS family permease
LLYGGVVLFALGVAPIYPGMLSWVVARAPAVERTNAVATFSAFFDLSMAVGGPLIGIVVAVSGEPWGMFAAGLAALCGLPLLAKLHRSEALGEGQSIQARAAE